LLTLNEFIKFLKEYFNPKTMKILNFSNSSLCMTQLHSVAIIVKSYVKQFKVAIKMPTIKLLWQ